MCNQLDKFVTTYDNPAVDYSALVQPENPNPDPPVSPEASLHEQRWCSLLHTSKAVSCLAGMSVRSCHSSCLYCQIFYVQDRDRICKSTVVCRGVATTS